MKRSELIEAAMRHSNCKSRYALSKLIGIDERRLSEYVNEKRWPDNTHARLLAEAAGLNWAEVIAELEIEQATDEQTRTAWGKALATLRTIAYIAVLWVALFDIFPTSEDIASRIQENQGRIQTAVDNVYYVKF